jgi:hypothetical protein
MVVFLFVQDSSSNFQVTPAFRNYNVLLVVFQAICANITHPVLSFWALFSSRVSENSNPVTLVSSPMTGVELAGEGKAHINVQCLWTAPEQTTKCFCWEES